jgi:hypothetical protein
VDGQNIDIIDVFKYLGLTLEKLEDVGIRKHQ